jgi:hypothetical protein
MIAIGCATTDERAFRAAAAATIESLDEGNSLLLRHHQCESIDGPYNEILAVAGEREDLEAVVLVHQDATIEAESALLSTVRRTFAEDDEVAMVAAIATGEPTEWRDLILAAAVLSPWAARNLRFDPAVGGSADASVRDIGLQVEASDRRALAMPLGVGRAWAPSVPDVRRRELSARVALERKWTSRH